MKTLTCLLLVLVSALAVFGVDNPIPEVPAPPPPGRPCPKGDIMCTADYRPVCGCTCDGMYCRTFSNACQLYSYNCRNTPDYNFKWNGTCDHCPNEPVASA